MEQNNLPEIMIITGMSGAGKSRAIEVFEDMGYNCVDNMPPSLITKFVEICCGPGAHFNRLCIVVDCRIGELFDSLYKELNALKSLGFHYRVLFLEASDEVLKRRYKETRRRHPLEKLAGGDIAKAIEMERKMLRQAKAEADVVIDFSNAKAVDGLLDYCVEKKIRYRIARSMTSSGVSMASRIGRAMSKPTTSSKNPLARAMTETVCMAFLIPRSSFCPI